MAVKKKRGAAPRKKATRKKTTTTRTPVNVLVEMRVDQGQAASLTLESAGDYGAAGFRLDSSYEPVPSGPPIDAEAAASLEEHREETVVVRGTVEEGQIGALKRQDNVLDVWLDIEIAPFPTSAGDEEEPTFVESGAMGTCPIPPCDCDHGTAACAKGALADVRNYLGVNQIWAAGYRGNGIVIGIVDGGITAQGRTPGGTIPNVIGGWPTANWGTQAQWGGHGNMTATDALGMANQANIFDLRIASGSITGTISNALASYQWAISQHKSNGTPHILSNSWGIYRKSWDPAYATNPNHPFTRKVVEAINEGILVLFAAGNCGQACPSSRCGSDSGPGKSIWGANGHPLVMTVGAANTQGRLIGYSSQGPASLDPHKPDFCGISHFKGYFSCDTGTSAACPVAAGVVALLKQCKPSLTQSSAKAILKTTAQNIGPSGWDKHSGSGIIRPKTAFDRICGPTTKPCARHKAAAARYLAAYRRTRNRRYLCFYYRYLAVYYSCLYRATRQRRYLCLYYRYLGAYNCCLYQLTQNRQYLCACYRYLAAYYCCLYQVTRNGQHLALCRRYRIIAARCR